MELLIVIGLMALICVVAAATGRPWGPAILALGFGAWGVLLLTAGFTGPFPLFGLLYVGAAFIELVAAYELVLPPGRVHGGLAEWRAWSAVIGATGSVAAVGLLMYIAAAVISAMIV